MLCNDNTISSSKINWNLIALNKGIPTQLISLNSKFKSHMFLFKNWEKSLQHAQRQMFSKALWIVLETSIYSMHGYQFFIKLLSLVFFLDQWDWCCILFVSVIFCNRLWSNNRRFLYQTVRHRWSSRKTRQ